MKKHLKILLLLLLSIVADDASAYDFAYNGIYYNESTEVVNGIPMGDVVEVTWGDHPYTGDVVIPEQVTYKNRNYRVRYIGKNAFSEFSVNLNYYGPTSITMPNSIISIGDGAFSKCKGLTSIIIPNSVTTIGRTAFSGCTGLTSIIIPNSVTTIGHTAFSGCTGLNSVTLESDTIVSAKRTSSTSMRFIFGEQVKTYVIGNTVKSVGDYAFDGCSDVNSINISDDVISIGEKAFSNCCGLTSITIPEKVSSIGNNAFEGCTGLQKVVVPNIAAWCGISFADDTANPLFNTHHIYSDDETEITDLVIPDGVNDVNSFAFQNCSGLTSVIIPSSVTSIGKKAFENCNSMTSVTLESDAIVSAKRTPYISMRFMFGEQVKTYVIGNTVRSIGDHAFNGCNSLTSVAVGNSVKTIGDCAFYGCNGLTSITIPESVTSIGIGAFYDCISLTSVTIPNSVTSIGGAAFEGTAWFNNQPDGLVYAGKNAYKYKGKMPEGTEISIKEGTLGISASAFSSCSGLTSVTIPNGVMNIGDYAFSDCSGLKDIYCYAEDVPRTGYGVYYNSPISAATLHVPAVSVDSYRSNSPWKEFGMIISIDETTSNIVFADASIKAICVANWDVNGDGELSEAEAASVASLEEVFRGNNSITSFDELQYFTRLTGIEDNAFCYCKNLTSITMPNNIASIGNGSFRNCGSLTSVTIPYSVTSIGERAFSGCRSLTSIKVEEGNTAFDSRSNCNAIIEKRTKTLIAGCQNTIIPNDVTIIGKNAFEYCSGLTSIIIPSGVTNIEQNAFNQCANLASVIIPNSVKIIGSEAFCNCLSIADITIPEGVTKIENNAFYYCNHLTSITIGNSVSYIGESAFAHCFCLTSIAIPNSVKNIYSNTFYDCLSLATVTIPNSVNSIASSAFRDCSSLNSVTIPESVTSIGNYAFAGCSNLTSVNLNSNSIVSESRTKWDSVKGFFGEQVKEYVIGNSVKGIGNYAFYDCSALTSIIIPESVTYIRSYAFQNCSNLTSVYCYAENVPSADSNAFENTNIAAATLHVPTGSVNLYKSTSIWSGFGSIIPLGGEIEEDNYIDSIYYSFTENDAEVTNGDIAYSDAVVIPASVTYKDKTYPVISISEKAFSGCSNITAITIPASVTSVGDNAFKGCTSLKNVSMETNKPNKHFTRNNSDERWHDYVAISGTQGVNDSEDYTMLLDNDINTKWCVAHVDGTIYIEFDATCPIKPTEYMLTTGNDTQSNPGRNPKSWIIKGRNSTSDDWTTLTTVDDGNMPSESFVSKTFSLNTNTAYRYYRFEVTSLVSGTIFQLSEFCFLISGSSEKRWINYAATNGTPGFQTFEDYPKLLDNDISTKWCTEYINGTIFVEFDATSSIKPTEYVLTTGNDTQSNPGRNPKSWKIKGKNSTSDDWTTLTTVDDGNMPTGNFASKTFSFNTNSSYRYYRFEVTSLVSGTIFQLSEFCFLISDNNDEPIDEDTNVLVLGSNGNSPLFSECPLDSVFIGRNISYSTSSDKGYSPFYCNTSLRSVNISGVAKEISPKEFYGCTNLKKVLIGDKISTIGDYAFYGCTGLKDIYCDAEQTPEIASSSFKNVDVSAVMLVVPDNSVELYKAHPIWRLFWVETETGLNEIGNDHLGMENDAIAIYNINGRKLSAPQKGINIIRMSDGTTRKVMIR